MDSLVSRVRSILWPLLNLGSLKCSVSVHWRCLASTQRDEILKAAREFDRKKWEEAHAGESDDDAGHPPTKRVQLDVDQITDFICGALKGVSLSFHIVIFM